MSTVASTFLVIGGFALLLLVLSLLGGGRLRLGRLHVGRLHFGRLHIGRVRIGRVHGGAAAGDGGAELSMPVIAGFLGAFGFGGAIVASLLPGRGGTTLAAATVVGLVAAIPSGWMVGRLVQAAMNMSTDATLTSGDLIGAMGVVITPVPLGGYGEVRLAIAGQYIKFNARSDEPLALGTQVFVISVPSPTSVLVEPTPSVQ